MSGSGVLPQARPGPRADSRGILWWGKLYEGLRACSKWQVYLRHPELAADFSQGLTIKSPDWTVYLSFQVSSENFNVRLGDFFYSPRLSTCYCTLISWEKLVFDHSWQLTGSYPGRLVTMPTSQYLFLDCFSWSRTVSWNQLKPLTIFKRRWRWESETLV